MTFSFPQNTHDFLVMLVPLLTLILSVAFLVLPGRIFRFMGLEAQADRPSAVCEGRSSFTGSMLAVALACLLLQEPIALQPGLNLDISKNLSFLAYGSISGSFR